MLREENNSEKRIEVNIYNDTIAMFYNSWSQFIQ